MKMASNLFHRSLHPKNCKQMESRMNLHTRQTIVWTLGRVSLSLCLQFHGNLQRARADRHFAAGTVAEPLEVVRTARNARLSVPRSISPRKTWINGSPRRSVGPISSPSKNPANGTPSRSSSHQPVNRHLDFSMDDPSLITRQSPQMPPPTLNKSAKTASAGKKGKNKRVFDLNVEEDDGDEETNGASIINGSFNDTYALPTGDDEPLGDSIIGLENGDDHIEPSIEEDQTQLEGSESIIAEPETTRGAKAKSRKSSGRTAQAPMDNPDESQVSIPTSTTRRGRPPKKQKTQALQDHVAEQASGPSKTMKGKRKPPIPARKPIGKASSVRAGSTGPRPNIVQRSETPATDSGALVTRSGRHSFKPLASWRGEKAIFGQRPDAETLPGIADIIRTEEIMPPPPRRRPTNKSGRPRQRGTQLEDLEEEDEELDPWETEMGIMHAQIMTWNQDTGKYDEDDIEEHGRSTPSAGFTTLALTNFRNRLRSRCHRNARYCRCRFQICEDTHASIFRLWYGPSTSERRQASQEFEEDANGLFRILRSCYS